jgi:hypothetical protein
MKQITDSNSLEAFALKALPAKLSDAQASELLLFESAFLSGAGDEDGEQALAGAIAALSSRAPDDKTFLERIVETLKYPTAAGGATETPMKALTQRFPYAPD